MSEFFDYNPDTGVTEYFDYDHQTGEAYIRTEQDLTAYFRRNQELIATGKTDKGLMDGGRELHFYASLPPVVQIELRQKGIDIYSKDPTMVRRMLHEINANYPYCKVTPKTHA